MKPDFDRAQNAATELLLQQDITSLCVDARNFVLPKDIIIDSMQNFSALSQYPISELRSRHIDGACLLRQGDYRIILYDDTISNEQRKHWGIVHELGHAYMNHTSDDKNAEIEAHFFAAQLVTPEIVLVEMCKRQGSLSAYDVYNNFNVSFQSAQKRIQTLQKRPCYNYSGIDRQLLEKFSPAIDEAIHRRSHVS